MREDNYEDIARTIGRQARRKYNLINRRRSLKDECESLTEEITSLGKDNARLANILSDLVDTEDMMTKELHKIED
jgi:predicted nuclease with TOPRIM domain